LSTEPIAQDENGQFIAFGADKPKRRLASKLWHVTEDDIIKSLSYAKSLNVGVIIKVRGDSSDWAIVSGPVDGMINLVKCSRYRGETTHSVKPHDGGGQEMTIHVSRINRLNRSVVTEELMPR